MQRIVQRSGVTFRLHDVGRTVRTRLAESGVPENVAEAVPGHASPQLVRTYNVTSPLRKCERLSRPGQHGWKPSCTGPPAWPKLSRSREHEANAYDHLGVE
jgi:hypothetical protein